MTIAKMRMYIKQTPIMIMAVMLATLVLFFDVASVSAFNGKGRPSGPPPYRSGQQNYNGDRGPGNYHSSRSPGNYRDDPGPRSYRGDRGQRFYRTQPFSPYGGPWRGGYGERRTVQSREEAQRMLNDYYMRRSMRIGPIRENRFYYEADILDRNSRFLDRVIIDKRSGRIRSIY